MLQCLFPLNQNKQYRFAQDLALLKITYTINLEHTNKQRHKLTKIHTLHYKHFKHVVTHFNERYILFVKDILELLKERNELV